MSFESYLTPDQRKIFFYKVLPAIFLGSITWLLSDLLFGRLFESASYRGWFFVFYSFMIFLNIILFVLLYIISRAGKNLSALMLYLIIAFNTGVIGMPIFVWRPDLSIYFHSFVSLGIGSVLIVFLMGFFLRDKFFAKEYNIWLHIIVFLFCSLIVFGVFFVFSFIFGFTNLALLLISYLYLVVVAFVMIFVGVATKKNYKSNLWMLTVSGILMFFVGIVIAILVVIIVIAIAIISEGDIAFPNLWWFLFISDVSDSSGRSHTKQGRRVRSIQAFYCKTCGANIQNNHEFCKHCGAPIKRK